MTPEAVHRAECCLLGAALLRPELVPEAGVQATDFAHPIRALIWDAICQLHASGQPVTPVSVLNQTNSPKVTDSLIAELVASVPTGENIAYHGRAVRNAAVDRETRVSVSAALGDKDLIGEGLIRELQSRLLAIDLPQQRTGRLLRDGLIGTYNALEAAYQAEQPSLPGIQTGLVDVDRYLGGLQRGVITVIGARPSVGKSSLCATIARLATLYGATCDYYSLEDTERSLHCRLLAQQSGVNLERVAGGTLERDDWQDLGQALVTLSHQAGDILVCDDLPRAAGRLVAAIERNAVRRHTDLVVLDYFQLLRSGRNKRNEGRADELSLISIELAAVARRLDIALLMAAQLRRDAEEGTPRISQLKDCGQLEQDAFAILLLEQRDLRDGDERLPVALCHVAKNKNGRTGVFPLHWDPRCVHFGDVDDELRRQVYALMRAGKSRRRA